MSFRPRLGDGLGRSKERPKTMITSKPVAYDLLDLRAVPGVDGRPVWSAMLHLQVEPRRVGPLLPSTLSEWLNVVAFTMFPHEEESVQIWMIVFSPVDEQRDPLDQLRQVLDASGMSRWIDPLVPERDERGLLLSPLLNDDEELQDN